MDNSIRENPTPVSNSNQTTTYYTPHDAIYGETIYDYAPLDMSGGDWCAVMAPDYLRANGTTSFQEISGQVFDNVRYEETDTPYYNMRRARPTDPAVGELMPVGEGVMPMLMCAVMCAVVIRRKLKKQE